MKKCKTCNEDKDLDEFHKDKARKDGLKGSCKMCAGSKAKNWRRNNRTRDSRSAIARKKKYRDRNQSFIANYLKENPCVSCGEANIVVDAFTGDNSTLTFSLSTSVSAADQVIVFVSNIYQQPTGVYTITGGGGDITFSSAPLAAEPINVIHGLGNTP